MVCEGRDKEGREKEKGPKRKSKEEVYCTSTEKREGMMDM